MNERSLKPVPKVVAPTLTLAIATIYSAVVSGDWSSSESALAVATVITAVIGYFAPPAQS